MGLVQLGQQMLAKDQVRQTAPAGVYGTGTARTADVGQGPGEVDLGPGGAVRHMTRDGVFQTSVAWHAAAVR